MRSAKLLLAALIATAPVAIAQASPTQVVTAQSVPAVKVALKLAPGTAQLAKGIAKDLQANELGPRAKRDPDNAHIFMHLAATHNDPLVVAGALDSLNRTWSRGQSKRKPTVNDDYRAVVKARLAAKDGRVRAGALKAVRLLISGKKPHGPTLKQVIALADTHDGAQRLAVLDALYSVQDFQIAAARKGKRKGAVVQVMLNALKSDKAFVKAAALNHLARAAFPAMPHGPKVSTAAKGLFEAKHPGVRGGALLLAAGAAKGKKQRAKLGAVFVKALTDRHAYVRSSAAEAIAIIGYKAGTAAVMKLLDDAKKNVLKVRGFTALDGERGDYPLLAAGGRRVDEAALFALASLSEGMKTPFTYRHLGARGRDARRAKAIAAAKAWFKANKAALK